MASCCLTTEEDKGGDGRGVIRFSTFSFFFPAAWAAFAAYEKLQHRKLRFNKMNACFSCLRASCSATRRALRSAFRAAFSSGDSFCLTARFFLVAADGAFGR